MVADLVPARIKKLPSHLQSALAAVREKLREKIFGGLPTLESMGYCVLERDGLSLFDAIVEALPDGLSQEEKEECVDALIESPSRVGTFFAWLEGCRPNEVSYKDVFYHVGCESAGLKTWRAARNGYLVFSNSFPKEVILIGAWTPPEDRGRRRQCVVSCYSNVARIHELPPYCYWAATAEQPLLSECLEQALAENPGLWESVSCALGWTDDMEYWNFLDLERWSFVKELTGLSDRRLEELYAAASYRRVPPTRRRTKSSSVEAAFQTRGPGGKAPCF